MKNAKYSINANLVYKNGYSGKNVNIAVLDTGVFKHKQLDGCIKHFMDLLGYQMIHSTIQSKQGIIVRKYLGTSKTHQRTL